MSGGMGGGEAGVPDDLLTTKGDTHGFDTSNARVPIGANTTVLTADSTQALGLGWAAPAAGYLQPTLGTTVIPSNTTVSTLDGLTLTGISSGAGFAKLQLLSTTPLAEGWTSAVVDLSSYTFSDYSEFQIYIDGSTRSATQELRLNAKSGGTGLATLYTNSFWWDAGGQQTINGGGNTYWILADTGAAGVFTHLNTEWKYKVCVYPNITNGSIRWLAWEGLIGTNVPAESMLIGQGHNATATGQDSTFEFYPSASVFGVGTLQVYGVLK